MKKTTFDIDPIGKPRLVKSDIWSGRPAVARWYTFKDNLVLQAKRKKYEVPDELMIMFYISMPESWSTKKRTLYNGKPHKQKPDIDNLLKAFLDALVKNDSTIYKVAAKKLWARKGSIDVFEER